MYKRLCRRAAPLTREFAKLMKQEGAKYNPTFAAELVPHCEHLFWCPEGERSCGKWPTRDFFKALYDAGLLEAIMKETGRILNAKERRSDGK